ncbi:SMP-30/gluconolactonase/LRE family protein [Pseudarthrobacter oxydans]|uniref:SMP-30/gluconolactonase/LRE family protein n=1 Tax=Pseudarthrobacter oxydans TaxID=1671 RepID=UPI00344D65AB
MTITHSLTLNDLVDFSQPIERVATDCMFTEGPIWMPDGSLLFSDIPADKLRRWHPVEGQGVVRHPNNKGNGMTLDNEGRLVVCEHATSAVAVGAAEEDRLPIASHWQGKELNSPNDVIVDSEGAVLFTDPTYGRTDEAVGVVRPLQQEIRGVFRIPAGGGEPELLVADMVQPNGLCLSRDESVLFVGDTARAHIRAFDMKPTGPLGEGRIFAAGVSATEKFDDGFVDGMKIDELGNLYVTGPGGIWVYAENGTRIGTIDIPEQAANLNWGENDWKSLFITANTSVYRVRMNVSGNRLAYML